MEPFRVAIATGLAAVAVTLTPVLQPQASAEGTSRGPTAYRGATESPAVSQDTSPRFDHIPRIPFPTKHQVRDEPEAPAVPGPALADPVTQTAQAPAAATVTSSSFPGIGDGLNGFSVSYAPPDPNGDIGADAFVEIVNSSIAVFDRNGQLLLGPESTPTLFSGMGNGCDTYDDGDGTVKYDKAANRWVVTEFKVTTTPYLECVAVSKTSDPLGQWYRYAFSNQNFPDYPKLGIWSDGYYTTFNTFGARGNNFSGIASCAYDRAAMLVGASATQQCFQLTSTQGAGLLPADIDGRAPPPAGAPNYQIQLWNTSNLSMWRYHVDWGNAKNSTLNQQLIPVAGYTTGCSGTNPCIPQAGTSQTLDSLGDRAMYRLAYRNDNGVESLVLDHSVDTGGRVSVRWYQITTPAGTPTVAQQSTFFPSDSVYRWMGSAATDGAGDIAIGYSTSSSATHPGIAFAVHAAGTAAGTLGNETTLLSGNGSQTSYIGSDGKTHTLDRWGDYTSMSIDPVDDCTFWYVNEFIPSNGAFNWRTQIGHFSVSGCAAKQVTASPTTLSFANTPVGTTSAGQLVTLTNTGSSTAALTTAAMSGPNAAEFSVSPPSVASLAPGASTTVTVTFSPTAAGGALGSLDVGTDARLSTVSVALSGTTAATAPTAPLNVTATPGNGQVGLTWTAPTGNGGSAVTGYNVYRSTSSGSQGSKVNGPLVSGTSFTDTGLTNGTTYYYQVTAVNSVGEGAASSQVSAVPATVPGAPTGVSAVAGNGQVELSWTAPSNNGGSAVTGYNVYRSTSSGSQGSKVNGSLVSGTSFTDTGLTNGTTYYYEVTAVNPVGEGAASAQVSAVPVTVPGAPTGVSAVAGNGQVALSWTAPSNNGGSAVTGYNVYRSTVSGSQGSKVNGSLVSGTSFTDTGLTNGTTYYYQVTAVNSVGEGAASSQVSAVPATVPGAPTGVSAVAGNGQVELSWTAPSNNGGSAVTGYNVYRSTSSGSQGSKVNGSPVVGTLFTDTGLTNGTTYYYQVTAINIIGEGPASTQISAKPSASSPAAPTALTAQAGNGQVALSWTAPSNNGGSAITGYNVYRSTVSGSQGSKVNGAPVAGTAFTDTGLTNGTRYYYQVAAVNTVGEGAASAQVSAVPASVASTPTGVTATAADAQVTLSWTAPSDNGGSAVTGYNIYRATTPGAEALLTAVGNVTSYVDSLVTNGVTYYYKVSAVNGIGESGASGEVAAKPVGPPGAPTGLTTSAGDQKVTLGWAAPADTGGSAVTGYVVYRSTAPGTRGTAVGSTTSTTFTDTSVTDGVTYYFVVTAVNAAVGEGAGSTQLAATPHGAVTVTVTSGPGWLTNQRSATFDFVTGDANGVIPSTRCSIDGQSALACASGQTYAGLADGPHTLLLTATDAFAAASTSYSWTVDATVPTAKMVLPTAPFTLGRIRVAWSGADATSGDSSFDVRYRRASPTGALGGFVYPSSWQGIGVVAVTRAESPGYGDCFAVRAHDRAGNVSSWTALRCTTIPRDDRGLSASAGWSRLTGVGYYLGTFTRTSRLAASLSRASFLADRLALVVTKCASCGTVRVLFAGRLVATVRLYAASTHRRVLVVLPPFARRTGTLTIRVVSSGKQVQIDGFGTTAR